MKLALFDFDGTLTTKDSLGEFIKYAVGSYKYYVKLLLFSPILILYKLKLMNNSVAKEKMFRFFFKDINEAEFRETAKKFSEKKIPTMLRENIYEKFKKHIENGDRVIVVSASMKCWLQPWTTKQNVELLSTELEFVDGKFSGRFLGKNCHGKEKLERVKKHLNLDEYEEIYTYGDSSGDDYILGIADHKIRV